MQVWYPCSRVPFWIHENTSILSKAMPTNLISGRIWWSIQRFYMKDWKTFEAKFHLCSTQEWKRLGKPPAISLLKLFFQSNNNKKVIQSGTFYQKFPDQLKAMKSYVIFDRELLKVCTEAYFFLLTYLKIEILISFFSFDTLSNHIISFRHAFNFISSSIAYSFHCYLFNNYYDN